MAGAMVSVSRVLFSTLTGTSIEIERSRIEADINNNIQLIHQANSKTTLESITPVDRVLACAAPEVYLISLIEQEKEMQFVPPPTMATRTISINSLDTGWDVIQVTYDFQAPEKAIKTEQRMIELHPTFSPRCP